MRDFQDGPASPHFSALALQGDDLFSTLATAPISAEMREAAVDAPSGNCVAWGIPFAASAYAVLSDRPVHFDLPPTSARWLVFMHTSDQRPLEQDDAGFIRPMRGEGQLNEPAADYVMCYAGGNRRTPDRTPASSPGRIPPPLGRKTASSQLPTTNPLPAALTTSKLSTSGVLARPGWMAATTGRGSFGSAPGRTPTRNAPSSACAWSR